MLISSAIFGYEIICDEQVNDREDIEQSRLRVDFDISWTDNTINISPEPAIWNRFVSNEVYEEFMSDLYADMKAKYAGRLYSDRLSEDIYNFIQDRVKDYQDEGLLK
ncbi:hypothetical protein EVB55_236 [Rhizobium phage RHph_Y68]|uniref:Uncharacterized protein n=1 Tax=Rhizobium phage RHph_Y68 TaxID=2509787 RepID=A0A7S5QYB9_9CAUD|nr:hypothetical protein PP934_gp236 [Rhizobium phage RHph_Y68]QIG68171.1 hypothetical protein EVB55_236 [Rhizobium phage RHph_Y68]